jgi:hypothetical protein
MMNGGSFTGNRPTPIMVHGKLILQVVRDDLWVNQSLSESTDSVISGCSAGGLAVYLHLDWWKQVFFTFEFSTGKFVNI